MSKEKDNKKGVFNGYFRTNWLIILLCFLSAVIIWGLIMKDENPVRKKTVSNIQLVLEGEADLLSRHLVVVGDRSVVLPKITVRVSTDLLKYAELDESDITASVDLRKINGEGEHELSVSAVSSNGTVLSISPKKVTITVDKFNSKKIPVEITTSGSIKSGLECGEIKVSKDSIQIEGAKSIISNIVKACYEIDLSDVDESINESASLTLYDADNNPVSDNEIYGEVPSVNITIPVYSYRELEFDVRSILINKDLINPNYELVSFYTVPEKIKVLSDDASVFDEYNIIKLDTKIDLSGAKDNIDKNVSFTLDNDVWTDFDSEKIEVHVVINEKQVQKKFEKVKVKIIGENNKYNYTYAVYMVDVTIKCGISLANKIDRDNIILYANVKDIENINETCYAPIKYEFTGGIDATDVFVELSVDSVQFVMTEK